MNQPLTSRGLMGYAGAILAGAASAALFAFAMRYAESVFIFLVYAVPVPLFLAGLGAGSLAGMIAAIIGTLALYLHYASNDPEHLFAVIGYAALMAAPTAMLSALTLSRPKTPTEPATPAPSSNISAPPTLWCQEGIILSVAAFFCCAIFAVAVAMTWNKTGGLLPMTLELINVAFEPSKQRLAADGKMDAETLLKFGDTLNLIARIFPALAAWTWTAVMIITMMIAHKTLKNNDWNLRPTFSLINLHIPNAVIYAAAATGLVATTTEAPYNYIGTNMCLILLLPIIAVGFVVVHAWARTTRSPRVLLTLFYVIISLLVWPVILVAFLGVLDQWMNFRRRFASGTETAN